MGHPLSTGKKAQNYKSVINNFSDAHGTSFSRKLFTPQMIGQSSTCTIGNQILSAGKTGERLMDRFIPCRIGENLQAKFEAVSYNKEEESKFQTQNNNNNSSRPA